MPRGSRSGGCGAGCLGLLILFAIVGRGCDPGPSAYSPPSFPESTSSPGTVAPASESTARLWAQGTLNVRSGPGTDFPVVRTVGRGEAIEVGPADDRGWGRVGGSYAGEYVYRASPVLRDSPPSGEATAKSRKPRAAEAAVNSTGATAMCRDGSLSYSAHRRGTCSHHGGVSVWY
jgi:Protein of unknown function (DUF3761)/Bacterial SH3 domain